MASWIVALADDLTGALEIGAKFAGRGIAARVTTATEVTGPPDVPVLVVDTETRHESAEFAERAVRETVCAAMRYAPAMLYKKTDSTLRGNIAAEFRALMTALPELPLVYVPAYPAMGRTVRGGRLFVNCVPVAETSFAQDPLNPIRESEVARFLEGLPVEVVDAETDDDVANAARRIGSCRPPPIAAGPAALADALSLLLDLPRTKPAPWPRVTRCLVVNGSLHPVSQQQMESARERGCFNSDWKAFQQQCEGAGLVRARRIGEEVRRALEAQRFDAVAVFGGDTAFGIHAALGHPAFEPIGEIVPGVPVSRAGDLHWITKAGGFGSSGILCDIRRKLS